MVGSERLKYSEFCNGFSYLPNIFHMEFRVSDSVVMVILM